MHDARNLQDLVTRFRTYQIGPGLFIYDRGIVSKRNLQSKKDLQWDTLCNLPINEHLKEYWRPWIDPQQFMSLSRRHRVGQAVFYVQLQPYALNDAPGYLAFCLNERQQRDGREWRRDEVLYSQKLLAQGKFIKPGLERFFDAHGKLLSAKLAQTEEFDGYSCVFYTRSLPQDQMLSLNFNKDVVEKAFRALKGIT